MNKKLRLALTAVLACIFAVSVVKLALHSWEDHKRDASYEDAAHIAQREPSPGNETPDPPPEDGMPDPVPEEVKNVDLAALQEVNPDVIGWICIPGTEVSYPLLRGEDNTYYLNHMWDREKNSGGSIYMDCRCPADLTGFNTIIYGHRMRNGSMFTTLGGYEDETFLAEHPTVYIADGAGVYAYDVFAAWEPSVTSVVYEVELGTDEERQEFLDACLKDPRPDTGITPGPDDRILTLSTCTGHGHATRWVVQCRLTWEYENSIE